MASRRQLLKLAGASAVAALTGVRPVRGRAVSMRSDPGAATIPGEVTSPYPTITNLAIEWRIEGDENLDGVVEVTYRPVGESQWRRALPLRRIPAGERAGFRWENKHAGSIFDLRPNTAYEIRLSLTDPDGGSAERTIRARTRPVPRPADNPRVRRVTPQDFASVAAGARPGDMLLLAPGRYGAFSALRDGEPGRPIVIRSQTMEWFADRHGGSVPGGSAIFDSISLHDRKYVHVEQVTVNGSIDLLGGEALVVRRCLVNALFGIIAKRPPGATNCYVADNHVIGMMPWDVIRMGHLNAQGTSANWGMGIEMTGPGNVICHNRVVGYRDAITLMEGRERAHEQVCIDIYNNDVSRGLDDGIEADYSMGNVRVLRNRLTNCWHGVSSQPSLGGPTYFIRNAMYNLTSAPFKLANGTVGDVILHNTVVKVGDGYRTTGGGGIGGYLFSRNNLCLGGRGGGDFGIYGSGPGLAMSIHLPSETDDVDYEGVGTHGMPFRGRIGDVTFESLDEMIERTGIEHAVAVGLDVFERVEFPDPAEREREPADLRLRAGSAAVGAGVVLPNINDDHRGSAPDLGAYELGDELPIYGPRPDGVDEEHGSDVREKRRR